MPHLRRDAGLTAEMLRARTIVVCLLGLGAMLGPGAALASAAPTEHEYELVMPTGDGEGEDPGTQVESDERIVPDQGDGESVPAAGSPTSGPSPTPAATTPTGSVPAAGERTNATQVRDQGESPLRGMTYALAPSEPAVTTSGTRTSAGGVPTLLIVLSGIALLVAAAGAWRLRRGRHSQA